MKFNSKSILFYTLLVAVTTFAKLLFAPRLAWSGFSPIIAIALFSGMMIKDKSASFLLPLVSLFISDLIIEGLFQLKLFPFQGLYGYQLFNYSLLLISTLVGWAIKGKNFKSVVTAGFVGTTLFFLLSNFSVWFCSSEEFYTHDLAGLVKCFAAGLPFYSHSLIATYCFLPLILLGYNYLLSNKVSVALA